MDSARAPRGSRCECGVRLGAQLEPRISRRCGARLRFECGGRGEQWRRAERRQRRGAEEREVGAMGDDGSVKWQQSQSQSQAGGAHRKLLLIRRARRGGGRGRGRGGGRGRGRAASASAGGAYKEANKSCEVGPPSASAAHSESRGAIARDRWDGMEWNEWNGERRGIWETQNHSIAVGAGGAARHSHTRIQVVHTDTSTRYYAHAHGSMSNSRWCVLIRSAIGISGDGDGDREGTERCASGERRTASGN